MQDRDLCPHVKCTIERETETLAGNLLARIDIPVHVHVMTADIQGNQELEDQGVFGVGMGKIAEKTGGGASNGSDQTEKQSDR